MNSFEKIIFYVTRSRPDVNFFLNSDVNQMSLYNLIEYVLTTYHKLHYINSTFGITHEVTKKVQEIQLLLFQLETFDASEGGGRNYIHDRS